MIKVRRFDVGRMDGAEVTPWGFLRAPAFASRAGVFKYKNLDGSVRRELRLPEEVFKEESLRSLAGVPVTDDHPDVPLITSENARKYMRGYTGDAVVQDGEFIKAFATITDADLIEKVKAGKVEVSCGYECEHEENPGVWQGQPYDVIQRNIQYNHLAVVDRGRAGPMARLRFDSDAEMVEENEEEICMVKLKIGDMEYDVPQAVADAYNAAMKEKETMVADMAAMKPKMDEFPAMEKKLSEEVAAKEQAMAKADGLEAQLTKVKQDSLDEKTIDERVKSRVKILSVASELLPAEKAAKMDSMSDLELKKEVILAEQPNADLKEKSEVYVAARFDSIVESFESKGKTFNRIGKLITESRADSVSTDAEKSRKAQLEKSKDLWKEPLAATK